MKKGLLVTLIIISTIVVSSCNSPEGIGKFVFNMSNIDHSSYHIYMMDENGANLIQITEGTIFSADSYPSFSPDGRTILFNTFRDNNLDIYVINTDGTDEKQLTNHKGYDGHPAWSPDGKKVIFVSSRDVNNDDKKPLYIMNSDGSEQIRFLNIEASILCPQWSPDGEKIAFHSKINGKFDIYTINIDGTDWVNLTDNLPSIDCYCPRYSPDGMYIVFESGEKEIYIMDFDGSDQQKLITNSHTAISPTWSPDGQQIAFISNINTEEDEGSEIYKMNIDGSNRVLLLSTNKTIQWIDWSY